MSVVDREEGVVDVRGTRSTYWTRARTIEKDDQQTLAMSHVNVE